MARGPLGMDEILETVRMVGGSHLDVRTITLGVNLRGARTPEEVRDRVIGAASELVGRHGQWQVEGLGRVTVWRGSHGKRHRAGAAPIDLRPDVSS